jgi:hypothetical protein
MANNLERVWRRSLISYALLSIAAALLIYHRTGLIPAALIGGLVGGLLLVAPFAASKLTWNQLGEWWLIRRATRGGEPQDGSRVAIIGTIRPVRETLLSPFSQTPCIAYRYEIRGADGVSAQGFAMAPASIRTTDRQIRLLAYPGLEVPPHYPRDEVAGRNAEAFVAAAQFTVTEGRATRDSMADLNALLADGDGRMRFDERLRADSDLSRGTLTEWILPVGATVCAIGRYSATRRALVPDPRAVHHGATIRTGEPSSFAGVALSGAFSGAFGIVISSLLILVAGLALVTFVRLDLAEQRNPSRFLIWPEVRLERWIDDNVRARLRTIGLFDSGVSYPPQLCIDCAAGKLRVGTEEILLSHASIEKIGEKRIIRLSSSDGDGEGVVLTFDRGIRITHFLVEKGGTTFEVPLSWLHPDDVKMSIRTLEDPIEGRVTLFTPDDSIRCHVSFNAIVRTVHPPPG